MSAIMAPSPSMRPAIYARSASKSNFPTGLTFIIFYYTWDLRSRQQTSEGLHRFGFVYYLCVSAKDRSYTFSTPPGCDEPTSRCQTAPSLWTLGRDQPVIPGVTFIR